MKESQVPLYANIFYSSIPSSASSTDSPSYASVRNRQKKTSPSSFWNPLENLYANVPSSPEQCYENLKALSDSLPMVIERSPSTPIYVNVKFKDTIDENSSSTKFNTTEQVEVNMVPNCRDKSDLYRRKMPCLISQWFPNVVPTVRPRRPSHTTRRHRSRTVATVRSTIRSSGFPTSLRHQRKSRTHTQSRVRLRSKSVKRSTAIDRSLSLQSVSNQIYTDVDPTQPSDEPEGEDCCAAAATDQLHSRPWTTGSENDELDQKTDSSDDDHEEFLRHGAFDDFRIRRCSGSSDSSTSSESLVHRTKKLSPSTFKSSSNHGVTLGLARSDIDFIHAIIQRSPRDRPSCDRITALREAYVRARSNQPDKASRLHLDRMIEARKIRDELEKYDALPIHLREIYEDEDVYAVDPPVPSALFRLIRFVATLKRRAQLNIRQWKKNFQTFRTRLFLETLALPSEESARMYRQYMRQQSSLHAINAHSPSSPMPDKFVRMRRTPNVTAYRLQRF